MDTDSSIGKTSTRKLTRNTKDLTDDANLIYRLCEVKARPKTIGYFLQSLGTRFSAADVGRIYKEVHGVAPPKGMLPYSPERSIGTSEKRLHASYYGKKYNELAKLGLTGAHLHLATYRYYLLEFEATVDDALLSFEQAFKIIQSIQIGDLIYAKCGQCSSHFLNVFGTPLSNHSCPVCYIFKKRMKRASQIDEEKKSELAPKVQYK